MPQRRGGLRPCFSRPQGRVGKDPAWKRVASQERTEWRLPQVNNLREPCALAEAGEGFRLSQHAISILKLR